MADNGPEIDHRRLVAQMLPRIDLFVDEGGNSDDELRDWLNDALVASKDEPVLILLGAFDGR